MSEWTEYQTIWLQPWCEGCHQHNDDRLWCQDDVWENCEECGAKSVKYVLAKTSALRGQE